MIRAFKLLRQNQKSLKRVPLLVRFSAIFCFSLNFWPQIILAVSPPESIVVPEIDEAYDLAFLYPMQQWVWSFEHWLQLAWWLVFGVILIWKFHQYILAPYLSKS